MGIWVSLLYPVAVFGLAPLPPAEYREDAPSIVVFVENPNTPEACGVSLAKNKEGKDTAFAGCVRRDEKGVPIMFVPNPCKREFGMQSYASVLCHELGHVNGWPKDHPNAVK